jgi:hypothetical protein
MALARIMFGRIKLLADNVLLISQGHKTFWCLVSCFWFHIQYSSNESYYNEDIVLTIDANSHQSILIYNWNEAVQKCHRGKGKLFINLLCLRTVSYVHCRTL